MQSQVTADRNQLPRLAGLAQPAGQPAAEPVQPDQPARAAGPASHQGSDTYPILPTPLFLFYAGFMLTNAYVIYEMGRVWVLCD